MNAEDVKAKLPKGIENNGFLSKDPNALLSAEEKRLALANAILKLAAKYDFPIERYFNANRLEYIGIGFQHTLSKSYVVPSFNGNAYPHLKCEFTAMVSESLNIVPPHHNRETEVIRLALSKATTSLDAIKVLTHNAILFVGSIGCRKTNSGTDCRLIFRDVETETASTILGEIIHVVNEQNVGKDVGFELTHLSEVAEFFHAVGQTLALEAALREVKEYEESHRLYEIYIANGGILPDYKTTCFLKEIPLDSILVA